MNNNSKGFVFIELMIVIAIISVGLVSVMTMINRTQSEIDMVRSRFIATYLGQEGAEIVRSIRDGNWMEDDTYWLDGLHLHGEDYGTSIIARASYDSNELDLLEKNVDVNNYLNHSDFRLRTDGGRYNHDTGDLSGFWRVIEITLKEDTEKNEDYLEVDVYVNWGEGTVHISNILYDWFCIPENDDTFCDRHEVECGSYTEKDNCGNTRTVDCGSCGSDRTFGDCDTGGSSHSVCQECDSDRCEYLRTEDCVLGSCVYSREVTQCCAPACTPETDSEFCDRNNRDCGTYTAEDNCGNTRTVDCGSCGSGEVCENGICVSDCVPETCSSLGYNCGTHNDGCGGTISCGSCSSGESCENGKCEPEEGVWQNVAIQCSLSGFEGITDCEEDAITERVCSPIGSFCFIPRGLFQCATGTGFWIYECKEDP